MTLLSLASKQIWPQVLGFLHLNCECKTTRHAHREP